LFLSILDFEEHQQNGHFNSEVFDVRPLLCVTVFGFSFHELTYGREFLQSTEKVKLLVGSVEQRLEIDVPKKRMGEVADFFKGATSENWPSGRTGVIDVSDEDPTIVSLFITWALTGDVRNSENFPEIDNSSIEAQEAQAEGHYVLLINCFLLGERWLSPGFKNAIIDIAIETLEIQQKSLGVVVGATREAILTVFSCTPAESPIRKILLDALAYNKAKVSPLASDSDSTDDSKCIDEFWSQLVQSLAPHCAPDWSGANTLIPPWDGDKCRFHQHIRTSQGYSCTKREPEWLRSRNSEWTQSDWPPW
jgi:hypothetical protein